MCRRHSGEAAAVRQGRNPWVVWRIIIPPRMGRRIASLGLRATGCVANWRLHASFAPTGARRFFATLFQGFRSVAVATERNPWLQSAAPFGANPADRVMATVLEGRVIVAGGASPSGCLRPSPTRSTLRKQRNTNHQ